MRTAVVTGAGSGLGRAIAAELIERGYRVHVTDVDAGAADRAAAELGDEARGSALDVRDEAACRGLAESIGRTDSLDLWVNNAGVFFSGVPWEQSAERRQTMLDVNVSGLMNGTIAALGPMRAAGRGHVVNVVSLAGIVAAPGEVAYSATKHAAMAFTSAPSSTSAAAASRASSSPPSARTGSGRRCSKTSSTTPTRLLPSPAAC